MKIEYRTCTPHRVPRNTKLVKRGRNQLAGT